jgi:hypothetical protein
MPKYFSSSSSIGPVDSAAQRAPADWPFGTIMRIGVLSRPAVPAFTTSNGPTPKATR